MKKNLLLITLCFFIFSCKKEVFEIKKSESTPKISVQEAKDFLNDLPNLQTSSQNESGFDAKSLLEKIDWKSATLVDSGKVLTGQFEGKPTENNFKTGFRKAVFRKDKSGKLILNILEFIPEVYHLWKYKGINSKSFDGKVIIYNEKYQLIHGYKYEGGKIKAEILPVKQSQLKESNTQKNDLSVTACSQESYVYYNALGRYEAVVILTCQTSYFFNYDTWSQLQQNDNDLINQLIYGGGGGSASGGGGITPIPVPVFPDINSPKIQSIKMYTNCFGSLNTSSSNYILTVFVQEPLSGSGSSVFPTLLGGYGVGHAFIGITKDNITQIIGFYPSGGSIGAGLSTISGNNVYSELHDNSSTLYTIKNSYSINANGFNNLLGFLNNFDPNIYTYNLFNNNCTNFVFDAAFNAGVSLPFSGNGNLIDKSPAQLGQDLRNEGSSTYSSNNAPVGNGPCN